ncbi:MAG TPA: hypothetical protein VK530_17780 [Candidatus Acidoferrum sp.]|nr:hypothetical protein [Candidatus Acidoferrum sp.]
MKNLFLLPLVFALAIAACLAADPKIGPIPVVPRVDLLSASNALRALLTANDTTSSNGAVTFTVTLVNTASNACFTFSLATSNSLVSLVIASDTTTSNALRTLLIANDTTTSNALLTVITANDTTTSNALRSLTIANDTTTSNGLLTIITGNDTTTSNALRTLLIGNDTTTSNGLITALTSATNLLAIAGRAELLFASNALYSALASGGQTPWATDINGGGHHLTNVDTITAGDITLSGGIAAGGTLTADGLVAASDGTNGGALILFNTNGAAAHVIETGVDPNEVTTNIVAKRYYSGAVSTVQMDYRTTSHLLATNPQTGTITFQMTNVIPSVIGLAVKSVGTNVTIYFTAPPGVVIQWPDGVTNSLSTNTSYIAFAWRSNLIEMTSANFK